jgi:ABC-type sugar transport system ATPase subunit
MTVTATRGVDVGCRQIAKRFAKTAPPALRGVDLDCEAGKTTVLLGPSGCGKTTLLRIIAGLERPDSGSVHIDGVDATGVAPQERGIGMVFQDYALYPDKTVAENIAFPLRMAHLPVPERRARVRDVARLLRLDELMDRRPAELSGGQRQRVGIGRALVRRPAVVLLDEPLSNLDAKLRAEMRGELVALHQEIGSTMIYVTHDQAEAMTLADRLIVMSDGAVQQNGSPEAVFGRPATTFVADFLGQMNLMPGRARNSCIDLGDGLELPLAGRTAPEDRSLVVGVRPDDVAIVAPDDAGISTLAGTVRFSELLGNEQLVHVVAGSHVVRVKVTASRRFKPGVGVRLALTHVHLFDSQEAGRRIGDLHAVARRVMPAAPDQLTASSYD